MPCAPSHVLKIRQLRILNPLARTVRPTVAFSTFGFRGLIYSNRTGRYDLGPPGSFVFVQ